MACALPLACFARPLMAVVGALRGKLPPGSRGWGCRQPRHWAASQHPPHAPLPLPAHGAWRSKATAPHAGAQGLRQSAQLRSPGVTLLRSQVGKHNLHAAVSDDADGAASQALGQRAKHTRTKAKPRKVLKKARGSISGEGGVQNSEVGAEGTVDGSPQRCYAAVIGVDPDVGGALSVLRQGEQGKEDDVQVFDTPTLWLELKSGRRRRRHDAVEIWQLLSSIDIPPNDTVAFVESPPVMPSNGKFSNVQSGFGIGVWTGLFAAFGVEMRLVTPSVWKRAKDLYKKDKDESRALAVETFPSMASKLARKKDHGRAEALLIASFGQDVLTEELLRGQQRAIDSIGEMSDHEQMR